VKRKYGSFRLTLEKGKKQSEEDIKKRRRVIELKYWVSNPLESVEDEHLAVFTLLETVNSLFKASSSHYLTLQQLLRVFLPIMAILHGERGSL
jgi:hypothetical protein